MATQLQQSAGSGEVDGLLQEIERWAGYGHIPEADGYHIAVSLAHRLMLAIQALQRDGWTRAEIVDRLAVVRAIHGESPFVRRLQTWPRGYAGDFETIEYMLRQRNRSPRGRLAYWVEEYALASAIAQQHRNKVAEQGQAIVDCVLSASHREVEPRLLVLAAGGSPDLRHVERILEGYPFRAVLLDQDPGALAFSRGRLPLIRERLTLISGNVVRGLRDVRGHGPFDLIVAGGLFDYLPDRIATLVLRHVRRELLAPNGRLMFTNIGASNPYRAWMEHVADWMLIHRTQAEVRRLCDDAGFADGGVSVSTDSTGLALLIGVQDVACEGNRSGRYPVAADRASARPPMALAPSAHPSADELTPQTN